MHFNFYVVISYSNRLREWYKIDHFLMLQLCYLYWHEGPGAIGNPKSACLHFYTAKTQAALALPFLPCSTLRVEQCFDSGSLFGRLE